MSQAGGFDKSFKAGADLDTTTTQFRAVYVNSSGSVNIATSATMVIGVIQNRPNPGTGAACWVRSVGYSKLVMGDTCSAGDTIITGDAGALRGTALSITAATSRFMIGRATEVCSLTGNVIEVLLDFSVLPGTLGTAND